MCGIAGFLSQSGVRESDRRSFTHIVNKMFHRGPDETGEFISEHVALGMRRLSIIDVSSGHQPFYSSDKSLALVCNGEIYNYIELRKELEEDGYKFSTSSDCETILHLYDKLGVGCLEKLRGMFAFAIWDARKNKLILARDRFGEKPLYYHVSKEHQLWFASEMKALTSAIDRADLSLSPASVLQFLTYQYVLEPNTMFNEIKKIPAAHYAEISLSDMRVEPKPYWELNAAPALKANPFATVREKLFESVELMMRSDVPFGLSLSGGIDSSLIAAILRKKHSGNLKAFSIGYEGAPESDERGYARDFSRKLDIEFHDVEVSLNEVVRDFPQLVFDMDDPIGDIAAYGYWSISRLSHKHGIKVLFSGLGADELFWGYEWLRDAADVSVKKSYLRKLSPMLASAFFHWDDEPILYQNLPWISEAAKISHSFLSPDLQNELGANEWRKIMKNADWKNVTTSLLNVLNESWLTSNCLALSDRTSSAHSVESRLPFLDSELVDAVTGLRRAGMDDWKKSHKWLLKNAVGDLLPEEVLTRKKRGFTPPTDNWMAEIFKTYLPLIKNGALVRSGIFNPGFHLQLAGASLALQYRTVLLEIWMRLFVERETFDKLEKDGSSTRPQINTARGVSDLL